MGANYIDNVQSKCKGKLMIERLWPLHNYKFIIYNVIELENEIFVI
jgi:hypothetical protein